MENYRLPYYIKIDETNDGIPIIHVWRFRLRFLINAILVLAFFGALAYLINALNLQGVAWVIIAIFMVLLVLQFRTTIALLIYVFHFFVNTDYIHLEPDGILKREHPLSWQNSLKIPARQIRSVMATQTHDLNNKPTKSLVINLDSGGMISLADNLYDSEVSSYLCSFINNYYGFDEKPKTNDQKSITEN